MSGSARARILAEARAAFAATGYEGASLRAITAAAGVDVALVSYYFGNKEALFRAVVADLCEDGDAIRAALERARHGAGEAVTAVLRQSVATPRCRQALEAVFRTVLSPNHEDDSPHSRVLAEVKAAYARAFGGPDSHPGNHLFAALFTGIFVMRHLIPVEPLASVDDGTLARVVAAQAQEILDAVDERGHHGGWGVSSGEPDDAAAAAAAASAEHGGEHGGAAGDADDSTKARILDAAGRSFGTLGYRGTTLRHLADEVGCNVALIPYHFGSKSGLFRAVVGQGLAGTHQIRRVLDARDQVSPQSNAAAARRAVQLILDMFTKEPSASALRAVVLSAASPRDEHKKMHAELMTMIQAAYDDAVGPGPYLAAWAGGDRDPETQVQVESQVSFLLFGTLPVGVDVLRSVMKLEPLARLSSDDIAEMLAPRLEWLLNGGLLLALREKGAAAG